MGKRKHYIIIQLSQSFSEPVLQDCGLHQCFWSFSSCRTFFLCPLLPSLDVIYLLEALSPANYAPGFLFKWLRKVIENWNGDNCLSSNQDKVSIFGSWQVLFPGEYTPLLHRSLWAYFLMNTYLFLSLSNPRGGLAQSLLWAWWGSCTESSQKWA